MSSDRTPADVIADALWGFQPGKRARLAADILAALAAAGFRVVPIPDDNTRAEVRDRVSEMRLIADLIDAKPDGIANEEDAQQWRRDADLLAAAYLDGQPEDRPGRCPECGSDDPTVVLYCCDSCNDLCGDPWHVGGSGDTR